MDYTPLNTGWARAKTEEFRWPTYTSDTLVGDVVTADPTRTRILERFGIDYCCNGRRSIADACTAASVDVGDLLAALGEQPGRQGEWAGMDDIALIEHIIGSHHQFLWDEFPRLSAIVEKVARVHGPNHAELGRVRDAFEELRASIEPHLRTEETTLFPEVVALARATDPVLSDELRVALQDTITEHDHAGELLAELRQLTNGYQVPDDACPTYTAMLAGLAEIESDLHMHVHKENNVLFPRVLAGAGPVLS